MLSFFDFRNDIRHIIKELSKFSTVIIYVRKEHEEIVKTHLPYQTEYRLIDERKGAFSKFLEILFFLFRKIPKTKMNYFLMEEFKIGNIENRKTRFKSAFLLKMHRILPHIISYDRYLNVISSSNKTDISDIDSFLCLTEIYDDYLFSRLLKENKKVFVYVYSWDHSCKHTRFSQKANYLVWNTGIKEDLIRIQQIPESRIQIIGSTQLGYLDLFNRSHREMSGKKSYYFFGCGIGIASLVDKEIQIIQKLSRTISALDKESKLLVRPYPNTKNWNKYQVLLNNENIILDDSFKQKDLSVSDIDIQNKFLAIEGAKGFFHLGTTLGLEACHTNCPSFIINTETDDGKRVNIYNFVNQYQNKKYLIDASKLNTISSSTQLEYVLSTIQDPSYMKLNHKIQSEFPVNSFEQIGKEILNILR